MAKASKEKTEFYRCVLCGGLVWKYGLSVPKKNFDYRGKRHKKGSTICFNHRVTYEGETESQRVPLCPPQERP